MQRLFSNGPDKDFVRAIFERLARKTQRLFLAAPYFDNAEPILQAVILGKRVQLLIGLNGGTSPSALAGVFGKPGVHIRYFTRRFHAKLYVFDDAALVGSANLTDAGMMANREGVICFDRDDNRETIEEVRSLFAALWEDAQVLTPDKLQIFERIARTTAPGPDPDAAIEEALGRAVSKNILLRRRTRRHLR
jgi:phosphatidylserine/phosphatidylglycerophosphate/cardiolipin synthase-like enzyme